MHVVGSSRTLLLAALTALSLVSAACGSSQLTSHNGPAALGPDEGGAFVSVQGLNVNRVTDIVITAQPANVTQTLTFDRQKNAFNGYVVLPVGQQTLTATARSGSDAGPQDVGTGSATTTITAGSSAAVTLTIIDSTPQSVQGDILPIITSLTATKVNLGANEGTQLSVEAVDLDGDALTYQWTSDCAQGEFSDPTQAKTGWASNSSGSCALTVTVTSKQKTVKESMNVVVLANAGEGAAQVNGTFVARPFITSVDAWGANNYSASSYRTYSANLPQMLGSTTYSITARLDSNLAEGDAVTASDNCGGAFATEYKGTNYANFRWTSPSTASGAVACKLTFTATRNSTPVLSDSYSVGVLVK